MQRCIHTQMCVYIYIWKSFIGGNWCRWCQVPVPCQQFLLFMVGDGRNLVAVDELRGSLEACRSVQR